MDDVSMWLFMPQGFNTIFVVPLKRQRLFFPGVTSCATAVWNNVELVNKRGPWRDRMNSGNNVLPVNTKKTIRALIGWCESAISAGQPGIGQALFHTWTFVNGDKGHRALCSTLLMILLLRYLRLMKRNSPESSEKRLIELRFGRAG